ncbi:adenosine deaminase AGSA-like [Ostrinia nubilalis]|uniref:adenosine deaminase AGSA-like n=1 Tax=Ostrinia nubilalis TaxID=29057 RepID=UPI00308260F6
MHGLIISVLLCLIALTSASVIPNKYNAERNELLTQEDELFLGGKLKLTEDEENVNDILMHWKREEVDESFANPENYNFSKHFFRYRNDVSKSKVYQIIKKMPKGAVLHVHASMMLDTDSLLRLTYEDHLYACYGDGNLQLRFADTVPAQSCPFKWELLSDLRNSSGDVEAFDAELRKHLTLYTDDKKLQDSDINDTWKRFEKVYDVVSAIIHYRPVRERFIYESLKYFYDDNVMYVEIRSGLHNLYELDGTVHDRMYFATLYEKVTNEFIRDYPDFVGIKFILTSGRWKSPEMVRRTLELARKLKAEKPKFFAGFDLVGQEDLGRPLSDFLPVLMEAKKDMDFFFHGGETNWFGTTTDENLVDAVLLGSKRIGHAYALIKHPVILSAVKQRDIALEVNVISNVVLSLVRDVRNHPLASYLAMGLPVVLSSDDPGAWEADPLSHDFYVAFVGIASRQGDLRMLKQLAFNSIIYSALDDHGKNRLLSVFNKRWSEFVKYVLSQHSWA